MIIALAGNPNSGKTTMYNALTGQNEQVGNWAGVTVEKKQHPIKKIYCNGKEPPVAVDLPGAYSMSPFTSEESVTRDYIKKQSPDVIINIVDATNLSRSLFFTTQLTELGIPVVIALNKADINIKKETNIDTKKLSQLLGCPVFDTVSTSQDGLTSVVEAAFSRVGTVQSAPYKHKAVAAHDKSSVEADDRARYAYVKRVTAAVEQKKQSRYERSIHDKIDEYMTNKWLGIPIFAFVMFLVFQISQAWVGPAIADGFVLFEGKENEVSIPGLVSLIELVGEWASAMLSGANPLLVSLLVDGVIGGVGAVVGFLPLVMVMYFLIALLEDCGYMARVSVVLDPIFKRVGLSGRSVIPFVIGTGCAVPGIMACRTIRDERERRATAMLAPFMPCGAKLPVISLFAGAFFSDAPWIGTLMYFVGIIIIFFGALLINKITGSHARASFFIIELPEYKLPSFGRAFFSMCSRGREYIIKAATIILLCNTAVQIMQSFTFSLEVAASADSSILASAARPIAYLLVPVVGVLSWQLAAAAITGFIAKENVVGTLAVCFVGLENLIDTEELSMLEGAGAEVASVFAISRVAALAYLMFNLFSPPCFAAMGAMRGELKSTKWFWSGILLELGVGYTVGYLVYTLGTLLTAPEALAVVPAVCGAVAVAILALVVVFLCVKAPKRAR